MRGLIGVRRGCLYILALCLWLGACSSPGAAVVSGTATSSPLQLALLVTTTLLPTSTLTKSPVPSENRTPVPAVVPTLTPTYEPSSTVTLALTASLVPTYAILRGVVIPEKVSCRYGPGWMYLYLYGMVSGATQDVIGRTEPMMEQRSDRTWERTIWLLTRSRGDNKSCWVKSSFMELQGALQSLEVVYPDKYIIPHSNQGYRYPWNVVAVRKGNEVTISWESEAMRPGDEESATSVQYVVETWVCRDGQFYFSPIGAYSPQVTVIDEPGCSQASHGRVYFSEKHGYSGPTDIKWP